MNITVCSPVLSPPRSAWTPIAPAGRAPDLARALEHESVTRSNAAPLGDRVGQPQRGAARRVALRGVVQLDDLGVELGAETLRGFAHEPDQRVDGEREVGRAHDRDPRAQRVERLRLRGREAGRAGDVGHAGIRRRARDRERRLRHGEVDRDVARPERGGHVVGHHHAVLDARADLGMLLALERRREHEPGL
jgi:hypothetical protein